MSIILFLMIMQFVMVALTIGLLGIAGKLNNDPFMMSMFKEFFNSIN